MADGFVRTLAGDTTYLYNASMNFVTTPNSTYNHAQALDLLKDLGLGQ
jgi:hypothetical protein